MSKQEELEYIAFKSHRVITGLFKDFLFILEELEDSGRINEEMFDRLRKRVLTRGNNAIRTITEEIESLDI